MSTLAEQAELRRQRILAKSSDRMRYVSGEIKSLEATEQPPVHVPAPFENEIIVEQAVLVEEQQPGERMPLAKTLTSEFESPQKPSAEVQEPQAAAKPSDTRPRWELKWEQDVSVVKDKKEISEETIKSLEVTANLAVEAPRAAATLSQKKNVVVTDRPSSMFSNVKLDSLLTTLLVIYLGVMSGITSGVFVYDNLWLPLGSFLLFALLMRVIISISFKRLGLVRPARASESDSGGMLSTALKFVPPPFSDLIKSFQTVSGYFKDSYDDMMLFVFAHGVTSRLVTPQKA